MTNCKVELKLKRAKFCVFSAGGDYNGEDNSDNNIIFDVNNIKLYVHVATFNQKKIKNYQKFSAKYSKDQFIRTNTKQKVKVKTQQITRSFLKSNFVGVNVDGMNADLMV